MRSAVVLSIAIILLMLFVAPSQAIGVSSARLSRVTFYDLANGRGYAVWSDGRPVVSSAGASSGGCYSYSGIHWGWDKIPVGYSINAAGGPSGASAAVAAGFGVWNGAGTKFSFTSGGGNGVSWGEDNPDWLAVAWVWYDTSTLEISSTSITFSTHWPWATNGASDAYDVQGIAAHESGHWLMLNDLYSGGCSEATMYGYASLGETKKRTLDGGDIAGIQAIYGQGAQSTTITVSVVDSITGKRISGAYVFLDGVWKGTTDGLGQLKITRVTQGSHTITVRKSGYLPAQLTYILPNQSPSRLTVAMQRG